MIEWNKRRGNDRKLGKTNERANHLPRMIAAILVSGLVVPAIASALRRRGIERLILNRGGAGWVSVRPLSGPGWRVPPGVTMQMCGVTDWGTRFTDLRRSYRRGSVEVLEDTLYFLWP
jgi:hypothetical protein